MRSSVSTVLKPASGARTHPLAPLLLNSGLKVNRGDKSLGAFQVKFWKNFLLHNLKVASEIEVAIPRGKQRDNFHRELKELLCPTRNYHYFGEYGVYDVIIEHCGIEIQVIGSVPYYPFLLTQYNKILSILALLGARTKATCGLHFHFLCETLLEPVPSIILENFWNFIRFFASELKYLTSAGERPRGICRRRNHNSHLELIKWEVGSFSLKEIQAFLRQSNQVPEHQNFLNLQHLNFNKKGDITNLHIELRFPDADICPTSLVAKIFLCLAILICAIDISYLGLIQIADNELWKRKVLLLNKLSNNDGTLAESDTTSLTSDDYQQLKKGAETLINLLRSTLLSFPQNPTLKILEFLKENPISFLRSRGWSWKDISKVLAKLGEIEHNELEIDAKLEELINFAELTQCSSQEIWKKLACNILNLTSEQLERALLRLKKVRELTWDNDLGSFIFLS